MNKVGHPSSTPLVIQYKKNHVLFLHLTNLWLMFCRWINNTRLQFKDIIHFIIATSTYACISISFKYGRVTEFWSQPLLNWAHWFSVKSLLKCFRHNYTLYMHSSDHAYTKLFQMCKKTECTQFWSRCTKYRLDLFLRLLLPNCESPPPPPPPRFSVSQSLVFCVVFYKSLFVLLSLFLWPLCRLFFFDLRLLITPLASLNLLSATSTSTKCWPPSRSWRLCQRLHIGIKKKVE